MKQRRIVLLKVCVWVSALALLAYLVYAAGTNRLGANPLSEIEHFTGKWTLRFLLITLAITPLRRITGWNWIIRFRRLFGLFAFFYASLHFFTYIWFDQNFVWSSMVADIAKRRFIYVGFTAWVLLIPLAVTSTTGSIRRLGGKRWNLLHRLTYVCGVLGVVHFYWAQKLNHREPIVYGCILLALFAYRLYWNATQKRSLPKRSETAPGKLAVS